MSKIEQKLLDYSEAGTYRKKSVLLKSSIRLADSEEKIDTVIDGKLERSGITKPGDYIVTGSKGEEYIIKSEKFPTLYEENPNKPSEFRSKNWGVAIFAESDITIVRSDGTEVSAKKGDALFNSAVTNTINVIDRDIFEKDYRPEPRQGQTPAALPKVSRKHAP